MKLEKRALVLLVEDNPADANLVEEALTEARVDCGLEIVCDGTKAVEFIAGVENSDAPCPDLILLDLNLPRMSGEEVLKRLRASSKCGCVKVLIVTSSDAARDRQRAMELGATDYFRKPSSLDGFLEIGPKIRTMLQL